MNTKLHAVTDSVGRPISLFITAGQVSDYIGARALCGSLPSVDWLIADRGYDADWFREALKDKGIRPCIPGRTSRGKAIRYDKRRYKRRNRIEIMFGRLKDWRRVATRYDRCPKVFLSLVLNLRAGHPAHPPDIPWGTLRGISDLAAGGWSLSCFERRADGWGGRIPR